MGMIDSELVLSAAQAFTAQGDVASTNVYDTGQTNGAVGLTGENLWLNVVVNTTVTSAGAPTLSPVLQDSADNATFADVMIGPQYLKAAMVAGAVLWQVQLPVQTRRYLRLVYRLGTADLTAGKFDAYITNTIERGTAYPSGFSVS